MWLEPVEVTGNYKFSGSSNSLKGLMYVAPRLLECERKYDEGTGSTRHCSRLLSTVTADASSLLF